MDKQGSLELGQEWEISYVETDQITIRYAVYKPSKEIKRFVVLINGRNEFIEKYSYITRDLPLPSDCGLITWDHRGQGGSSGQTSHCESFNSYVNDAHKVLAEANSENLPYIILAHSMGGLISIYGIIKKIFTPGYLLLSAPFLGMPEKPLPHFISRPLSETLTNISLGNQYVRYKGAMKKEEFFNNQKTHCRQRYDRMKATPYEAKSVTYGWVRAAFLALDEVHQSENIINFSTPTHIMVGDQESVVDMDSMHTWINKCKLKNPENQIEFSLIRGAKHELLSEAKFYYDQTLMIINAALKKWSRSLESK
ncbi:MAG: alpha/beta hydrolase [Oligoflexales bacterium]